MYAAKTADVKLQFAINDDRVLFNRQARRGRPQKGSQTSEAGVVARGGSDRIMKRIVFLLGITALAAISLAQCTVESTDGGKSVECLDVPQSWVDLILVEGGLVPLDNLNIAAIRVDGKIEAKLPGSSDWKPYFRNSTYPHMVGATVDGVDGVAAWLTTISKGTTFPVNAAAARMSHFGTDQPDNFRMSPTDTSDVAQCLSQ